MVKAQLLFAATTMTHLSNPKAVKDKTYFRKNVTLNWVMSQHVNHKTNQQCLQFSLKSYEHRLFRN